MLNSSEETLLGSSLQGEVTITRMRKTPWFLRVVSVIAVVFFMGSITVPQMLIAKTVNDIKEERETRIKEARDLTGTLKDFRKLSRDKKRKIDTYLEEEGGYIEEALAYIGFSNLNMENVDDFKDLKKYLKKHNKEQLAEFKKTEKWIKDKDLGKEIEKRHKDMVKEHKAKYRELEEKLQALFDSESIYDQQEAVNSLTDYANGLKLERSHEFTDPNRLPFGTRDPSKVRKPVDKDTVESFREKMKPKGKKLGTLDKTIQGIESALIPKAHAESPQDYLSETIEVQFTQDIIDKAAELNHDPVTIYNWVRNNVESIPTFGSIQGADMTLATMRGNPFDIASLLVALLRVSGTPARFAIGSVAVDADQAVNWVGGAGTPKAAGSLLAQGGVPSITVTQGGEITHIFMEHIWVEAYVDFEPSRGAHNVSPDTWIPMDASFKQYEYTEGYDLENEVPFDAQGLIDEITANAVIDESAGTIQGIDQEAIKAAFASYQTDLEAYVNNQDPDATVGEVLGTKKTIIRESNQLSSGLPYQVNVKVSDYLDIPDDYRHKWQAKVQVKDRYGNATTLIQVTKNLVEINDKTLAIHFDLASEQDQQMIASLLPEVDENGEIDPKQLPSSLPSHLINVVANISLNDENIQTSEEMPIGSELNINQGVYDPVFGWERSDSILNAGEYVAIGVNGSQINPKLLDRVGEKIEDLKHNVSIENEEAISKHDVMGNLAQSTLLSYFSLNNYYDEISEQISGTVLNYNLPSFGTFGSQISAEYGFVETPTKAIFDGFAMDVDYYLWATASKNDNQVDIFNFHLSSGMRLSAMEHEVPEIMLTVNEERPFAFSTMKVFALATNLGQEVVTIDSNNLEVSLSSISVGIEVKNEIREAVKQGKLVQTHFESIDILGETNVFGYIILDPKNGTAAFKISNGLNGGYVKPVVYPGNSCDLGFWERTLNNFIETNLAIMGVTTPIGLSLATAKSVANSVGGFTLLDAVKLFLRNPANKTFLLGNVVGGALVAALNFFVISVAWGIGTFIGSAITATRCKDFE